jgi:uncharacterized protein (TIGR02996 family)
MAKKTKIGRVVSVESVENGLLSQIEANPQDNETRSIYADFLEEHGEHAKAAFLRTELAKAPISDTEWLRRVTSKRVLLEVEFSDVRERINAQLKEAAALLRDASALREAHEISADGVGYTFTVCEDEDLTALVGNFNGENRGRWESSTGSCD